MINYVEPTRRGRLMLFLLYASFAAWSFSTDVFLIPAMKTIAGMPLCESLPWLRAEIIYFATFGILACASILWRASQLLRHRQNPLPGDYVFRRKKISRGKRPLVEAALCILVGLASLMGLTSIGIALDVLEVLEPAPECGE